MIELTVLSWRSEMEYNGKEMEYSIKIGLNFYTLKCRRCRCYSAVKKGPRTPSYDTPPTSSTTPPQVHQVKDYFKQ